jgi:hypothetical protein
MTSGEGVRLPRVKWDPTSHAPRGGIPASVLETYMVNVPPGGRQMAANTVGKPLQYCFAHLDVHGHNSLGQSLGVPAATDVQAEAVCQLNPVVITTAANPNIMPGLYADYGGYDLEVPMGPVNPNWREAVMEFAQSRRYSGLSREQDSRGNEERLQRYKDRVDQAISLCQGPRSYQTNIDFVASYCAVALCEGRAQPIVQQVLEKNGRLPLKRELFFLLQDDIRK